MKIIFFNLILVSLFNTIGCVDPENCPERFHVPAEIIPYKIEYHIGDTIKFISKFERHVHELRTDRKYDMINTNWFPNGIIQYLDTVGGWNTKISSYFNLVLDSNCIEYITSRNSSVIDCNYKYSQDTFSLTFSLIPKRIGNYFLSQKCGFGPNFNDPDFPGKCRGSGVDAIVDMNPGKDGNIELLKLSKDSFYFGHTYNNAKIFFYDKGGFCFKVVP
ncbi:MAG: hypothetical protein M3Q56_13065 [Bacteroidota bacterium]|nr:hypothetical protein [Bacteroidota bacterium]